MTQVLAGTIAADAFQQPAVIIVDTTPWRDDEQPVWWGVVIVKDNRLPTGTYTLTDHDGNTGHIALISRAIADDGDIHVYRYLGFNQPPPAWMTPPQQGADNT